MDFQLITLDGVKYSGDAYSIVLPTVAGVIDVLPGHEPLMSALKPGIITIRRNKADLDTHLEHYATYGGVVEITTDAVRVLVDEANQGDEINEQEAQKAQEEARRMLETATERTDIEHAQAIIDRQAVRLQVADLKRRATTHPRQR